MDGVDPAASRRIPVGVDSLLHGTNLFVECLLARFSRKEIDPAALPYREEVLDELRRQKSAGAKLILLAEGRERAARTIAAHIGIFDEVSLELDHPWRPSLPARKVSIRALLVALRPHQWLKNVLVFLPFLLAHEVTDPQKWVAAALLFSAFSLCASATYVINDIMDRRHDRRHPVRAQRPIASGALPLGAALWLPLPLLSAAALCCAFLPAAGGLALAAYIGMTIIYSAAVKKLVMGDVLLLAALYLLRLIAGSLATGNVVSHWLMGFALALFLSLALAKRVSELIVWWSAGCDHAPGRAYRYHDAPVLEMMAVASGFLACLIMILYIQSPEILRLYRRPQYLWVGVIALLYWLGRLFLYAHRGECPEDPLLFVLQDKTTLTVVLVAGALAVMAI
jgi:4-hydroxybenzoate polyprenyltransferase